MNLKELKKDIIEHLENSNVNLGRKTSKTRSKLIKEINAKFDDMINTSSVSNESIIKKVKKAVNPMDDRVKCIKPKNTRKALQAGKGVAAMTGSESMRADEQLNRSPFTSKEGKE